MMWLLTGLTVAGGIVLLLGLTVILVPSLTQRWFR